MRHLFTTTMTASALILALGACQKTAVGEEEVAAAKAGNGAAVKRSPGLWRTIVEVQKVDIPGMPAEMTDGMKQMMEGASGLEQCVTPEQAAEEDLAKDLAQGPDNGGQCTFDRKNVSGGKIDVAGTCTGSGGEDIAMKMTGTMGAEKTDVTMAMTGKMSKGGPDMDMRMRIVNTRIGDCKDEG